MGKYSKLILTKEHRHVLEHGVLHVRGGAVAELRKSVLQPEKKKVLPTACCGYHMVSLLHGCAVLR